MFMRIFVFIISFFANDVIVAQVGIEIDGKVMINNIDTVLSPSQMMKLVRKNDGQLAKKSSRDAVHIQNPIPLPYTSEYEDYNTAYEGGYYYKHKKRVYLGGLVKTVNASAVQVHDTIAILPQGYRPFKRLIVSGLQASTIARLNIETNGVVRVIALGDNNIEYIGLSGISFPLRYELGDEVGGGLLFYVVSPPEDLNGDGILDRGLVAAPFDQPDAEWGCSATSIPTTNEIGSGYANTDSILMYCNVANIAAEICGNLNLNGYSDWYLPSRIEAELMWDNLADSNGDGENLGITDPYNIGQFEDIHYWSSYNYFSSSAWVVNFSSGVIGTTSRITTRRVRAIRVLELE